VGVTTEPTAAELMYPVAGKEETWKEKSRRKGEGRKEERKNLGF
jgi:hypothetical protein